MANIYDLTDTWSDGNTTYTSIKMNVTNTASSAASKLIDMQVVGTGSLFSVDKLGKLDDVTEPNHQFENPSRPTRPTIVPLFTFSSISKS